MSEPQDTTKAADGQSHLTGVLGEVPTFIFRGDELLGFIWQIYSLARVGDALAECHESRGIPKEPDPMENQDAQDALLQGWINDLQSLPVRCDGTVEFAQQPWIVRPNAKVSGRPHNETEKE